MAMLIARESERRLLWQCRSTGIKRTKEFVSIETYEVGWLETLGSLHDLSDAEISD
jgi:hypothetical protein